MRILRLDRREGVVRVSLQTLEDLWHLHKVLEPGDWVRATTYRKVAVKRGSEIVEGEKKPVNLTIRLDKSEFHQYTGKLRLAGVIVSGPEDIQLASHHTITVEPGMIVSVKKPRLKPYHVERLEKARVAEEDVVFVAIDREQADFARLGGVGLEMRGSVRYHKTDVEDREPFYGRILETLQAERGYGRIVLCGPGFERENLQRFIRKRDPGLARAIIVEHASDGGKPGIQEVIKSAGDRILQASRVARETALVEELLLRIKKRERAAYGRPAVEKAVQYGAAERLLVSDTKVRELEPLLDAAESIAAAIALISTDHQAGEQLLGLGGVAATLRFAIE